MGQARQNPSLGWADPAGAREGTLPQAWKEQARNSEGMESRG